MRLFNHAGSGNCYKIRLLLSHLGIDYETIDIELLDAEDRESKIGGKTPIGRVPVLELDDGRTLAESNAILFYLADGTSLSPSEPFARAGILQWLFFEQNLHEPNIATARFLVLYLGEREGPVLEDKRRRGRAALQVMEDHLAQHEFFNGDAYSIADIALYAYTHVAEEGGFDLEPYPAIRTWFERVESQPGWVPMVS